MCHAGNSLTLQSNGLAWVVTTNGYSGVVALTTIEQAWFCPVLFICIDNKRSRISPSSGM